MIRVRRVYNPPGQGEGERFLVDRLWLRGLKKESLRLDAWLRDVAPSDALRRWFGHNPKKWEEFRCRYFAELDGKGEAWEPILKVARRGNVTLLFSARDTRHNNVLALRDFLMAKLEEG